MTRRVLLSALLVLFVSIHLAARVSVWRDVEAMGAVVQGLPARDAYIYALPLQIGAHYGYLPALPARGRCYVDPVWIWRRGLPVDPVGSARMLAHESWRGAEGILSACR